MSYLWILKYVFMFTLMNEYVDGFHGSTRTSRYWDCCKPSCAWKANSANATSAVNSCTASGRLVWKEDMKTGCAGGTAFMCNSLQPWIVNDYLAYGFASVSFIGAEKSNKCCTCFRLDFEGSLAGKLMIVQIIDIGSDLGYNEFNLAIPGGGIGYHQGCLGQWGLPANVWGDQYGGLRSVEGCPSLPKPLRKGCEFRYTFMEGITDPGASFTQVRCPSELVALSGCEIEPDSCFCDQIVIKK